MSRGYQPDWDLDLQVGEAQELRVEGILADIRNGATVEVKSDFFTNEKVFLEVQDRRRHRADYRDTGPRTSRAQLFALNKPTLNVLHVYPTAALRELERRGLLGRLVDGGVHGDCPTKGYNVTASLLDRALAYLARIDDEVYDQEAHA